MFHLISKFDNFMKNLVVLGSTGSIGISTLDVVRKNKKLFKVEALIANTNYQLMIDQYEEFRPSFIYLANNEARKSFLENVRNLDKTTTVLSSEDEITPILGSEDVDIVIAAIVGFAGLKPVYNSLLNGKQVLLANKESYVVAGEFLNKIAKESNSTIFPIDSEHSAIHQCLQGIESNESVSRLILTGSGGPFLRRDIADFASITPDEAIAHPVWSMGKKISVDSSTMMNKCLEIIEARWLFDIEEIDVIIHPEGIIHSLVEFNDNSVIAQLSMPDMKIPIAHALGFPEKITSGVEKLNLAQIGNLSFEEPNLQKFPAIRLAEECLKEGGSSFTILNAANEVCVDAFLERKIGYLDIHKIITKVLDKSHITDVKEVEEFFEVDKKSRYETNAIIAVN